VRKTGKRIDRNYLVETIRDFSSNFYVCGPDEFVKDMTGYLLSLGANAGGIIFEQ
jgi:ferredoxin-NADP reductase